MTVALYPGSFDPPTNGHVDVAERASRLFESVVVSVVDNPSKKPLFAAQERVTFLKQALSHLDNIEVEAHQGLTVDLARDRGAGVIVKGFRAASDFDYELQQAQMNHELLDEVDTLFIATNPRWSFLSSSLVKEVARYGGDVEGFVPSGVLEALKGRFGA